MPAATCRSDSGATTNVEVKPLSPSLEYVVAFRGARDYYEAALALSEANKLACLVTDAYTPSWMLPLSRWVPKLSHRHKQGIPNPAVKVSWGHAVKELLGRPIDRVESDDQIGKRAALQANRMHAASLIYSYYWESFLDKHMADEGLPRVVFLVHPLASQIVPILRRDRALTGHEGHLEIEESVASEATQSFEQSLLTADGIIVASTFVAEGVVSAGAAPERVHVVPYGADRLSVVPRETIPPAPLRVLWVGQIAYRKAMHHVLAALTQFEREEIHLTVVTRSYDTDDGWVSRADTVLRDVDDYQLSRLYSNHHILVMPSLAEGFGLIFLEAMNAGLPVVTTSNTGVPDVTMSGKGAWIVRAGDAQDLSRLLKELIAEPDLIEEASMEAALAAREWTWARFRGSVRSALVAIEST